MFLGPRQRIFGEWILNHRGFFYLDQIIEKTGYSRDAARSALKGFVKAGFIREIKRWKKSQYREGRPPAVIRYGIINKRALSFKIKGQLIFKGMDFSTNRMWYIIRQKKSFNIKDIVLLAEAEFHSVRWFLQGLGKLGYITPNKPTGRGVYWTLIRDPGPLRPYIKSG